MEPNTVLFISSLAFMAIVFGVDRLATTKQKESSDRADVEKKRSDKDMFADLSDKLVSTIETLNGGLAEGALRRMGNMPPVIEPDGREASGRTSYIPRENGQHRASDNGAFSAPRPAAEAGR